ncbi:MAG: ribosome biogenesis GTPase Der, partial [Halothiobacillus sp.]
EFMLMGTPIRLEFKTDSNPFEGKFDNRTPLQRYKEQKEERQIAGMKRKSAANAERRARMEAATGSAGTTGKPLAASAKAATKPARPATKPAARPAAKPSSKPSAKPSVKAHTQAAAKPAGRKSALSARPAAKPAQRSGGKPGGGRKPSGR